MKTLKNLQRKNLIISHLKLITVSRLDGRKSHQNIIMTVKNLLPKFPNLKYISVGDGDEKDNLEKTQERIRIRKRN
jgi:phosphatidylinositol alpha-1,6-mannosyltransferase